MAATASSAITDDEIELIEEQLVDEGLEGRALTSAVLDTIELGFEMPRRQASRRYRRWRERRADR